MNAEALLSQNPPGKGGKPGTWKMRVWVRDQPYLKPRRVRLGLGRARSLYVALIRAEAVVRAMLVTGVGCDRVSFTYRQCLPSDWEALLWAIRARIAELRTAKPGRRGEGPGCGPVRMLFDTGTDTTTELGAKRAVAPRRQRRQNRR